MKLAPDNTTPHAPRRGRGPGRRRAHHRRRPARRRLPLGSGASGAGRRRAARARRSRRPSLGSIGPGALGGEVFDRDGLPRTEALVDARLGDRRRAHRARARRGRADAARAASRRSSCSPATPTPRSPSRSPRPSSASRSSRVGAGLRCGDFSLSEEINRMLIDRLADLLFTDSPEVADALECEGIDARRVQHVGNTAVDLLRRCEADARSAAAAWRRFGVTPRRLRAGHAAPARERARRPARRRGSPRRSATSARRTPGRPAAASGDARAAGADRRPRAPARTPACTSPSPLGYLDFLSLEQSAGAILTDSGLRPGRGVRARRPLLHAAARDRARRDAHPRHQRAAGRRPGRDRRGPPRRIAPRSRPRSRSGTGARPSASPTSSAAG